MTGLSIGSVWGAGEALFLKAHQVTITGGGDPWILPEAVLLYGVLGLLLGLVFAIIIPKKSPAFSGFFGPLLGFLLLPALFFAKHVLLQSQPLISVKGLAAMIGLLVIVVILYALVVYKIAARWRVPKTFLVLALFAAIAIAIWQSPLTDAGYPELPPDRSKPNVVLITMDTTRADHLSLYGYVRRTTPFLTNIGRNGVVFQKAYSVASWTLPSHASLFTGKLPSVHGAMETHWWLDSSEDTMAEILKRSGYYTGGFVSGPYLLSSLNMGQGFDYYDDQLDFGSGIQRLIAVKMIRSVFHFKFGWMDGQRNGREVTDRAIEWLSSFHNHPFFLFVNYFDPHDPYQPPPPFDTLFDPTYHGDMNGIIRNLYSDRETGRRRKGGKDGPFLTNDDYYHLQALYDGEITFMDLQIARLIRFLQTSNKFDNTIVIILSDHGESIGDHQILDHGHTLYEEQVHIPLIVEGPGIPANWRISALVRSIDILPTVLQLIHVSAPADIQGKSFADYFSKKFDTRTYVGEIFQDPRVKVKPFKRDQKCYLENQWKLLWSSNNHNELYDIDSDFGETQNQFPGNNGTAMIDSLFGYLKTLPNRTTLKQGPLDESTLESLKSTNYINN